MRARNPPGDRRAANPCLPRDVRAAPARGGTAPAAVAAHGGQGGFQSYPDALWWTAMIMTTMGSDYWSRMPVGRMLAFLLSSYAFTFLGYTAATIASHFVGEDEDQRGAARATRQADVTDTST